MRTKQWITNITLAGLLFAFGACRSLCAGEVSRKADFLLNVSQATRTHEHGSTGAAGSAWSYSLIPDYSQCLEAPSGELDCDRLLASNALRPVNGNGNLVFEAVEAADKQTVSDYKIGAESISLNWKSTSGTLVRSAILLEFRIPKDGTYSLCGNLEYLCEKPATGAILIIGLQKKTGFHALLKHPFGAEEPASEAKLLKALGQEAALQDLELVAGDRILFVVGSARQPNRPFSLIDGSVRIASDALPPMPDLTDKARVLSLLDLNRPELAGVQSAITSGKIDDAFERYKAILAMRAKALPPVEKVHYWLHGAAKADELLEGVLTTGHYGQGGNTTYTIGKPGAVDWFKVPEDGYNVILRDITTMHWTNKLAEAYAETGDGRYLDAYLGYWCDFTTNWYPRFEQKMRDPKFRALLNGSISWSASSRLYNAMRLGETLGPGLCLILHRAMADNTLARINNDQLAKVLAHVYYRETPPSMRFLQVGGGVPNQQQSLAAGMFFFGVFLQDMKGTDAWRKASLDYVLKRTTYLPDGTDMEQSFNYLGGFPRKLQKNYIRLASALPLDEQGAWTHVLEEQALYRSYFLQSITMPMGGLPICGCNNTWKEYSTPLKFVPGITDDNNSDQQYHLTAVIKDRVYGEKKLPEPAFRSVYFPYGGYYALRSDWGADALYSFMKVSRPAPGHSGEENNAMVFSAFGRQLLIHSGHNGYNPKNPLKGYGGESFSTNTIAVDGFGQRLRLDATLPPRYDTPLACRFLDGAHFSFAEGVYDHPYAGANFLDPKLTDRQVIHDVRHTRQVLLLRSEKIWIVTDRIQSEQEHRFTQTWNFPPDFKNEDVTAKDGVIRTTRPSDVNIALHQFRTGGFEYEKYYGMKEGGRLLGWVSLLNKETGLEATPAVDVHCSWRSKGEQVLITVIVPFKTDNPVKAIKSLRQGKAEGVEVTLADGGTVEYVYGADGAEATLKTPKAAFTLLPGGGCEKDADTGEQHPVIVPAGFRWTGPVDRIVPSYTP